MKSMMYVALLLGSAAVLPATPAQAQATERRQLHLPAQSLAASLRSVAASFGRNVSAPSGLIEGRSAPALEGAYTFEEAVRALLEGSGLRAVHAGSGVVIESGVASQDPEPLDSGIVVTGSRIRGAKLASPVIRLDRAQMRDAGQATLSEALAAVPQNFGGGQNPGIGFNVPEGSGADIGGGASVNLRGLGSDATLTLLDGHRLSYSAADQSVDISAIPFGMVERVEIVPDGASALFGSDAVAGVVNVILRRDLDGVETSARVGGSTDGGNLQQQYALTAGHVWSSGSLMAAYQYDSNSAILAEDRSYAARRSPGLTLYPPMRHHAAGGTSRQALSPSLTFGLEALFNKRWSSQRFPLNEAGDLGESNGTTQFMDQSWVVAPSLTLDLPANWHLSLAGSAGKDRVDYGGAYHFGAATVSAGSGFYRNQVFNAELSGNGDLLALPGGTAKLALGAGYRRNAFVRDTSLGAAADVDASQGSYYGFAELNLPLIGPAQGLDFVHALTLSAAARYERYPGIDEVVTPKFGLVWEPTPDLSVKASWGKSFRAPTFYEEYQAVSATLVDAVSLGAAGLPPGATALRLEGGNARVRPERSTNWSGTIDLHPRRLPGFELEISYFRVNYRDRIVTPIPFMSNALSDPAYGAYVSINPGALAQADALGRAATFLNLTSDPYDPARVVAIVDNTNVNAGRQRVHGVDLLLRYAHRTARSTLSATLDASWLESERQFGPGQPIFQLAGVLYNPPHFRGRSTLGWETGPWAVTGAFSFIGPVEDRRAGTAVRIGGMAPVDLTLRWRGPAGRAIASGLEIAASVQNLFNAKPAPVEPVLFIDAPYDSSNYSPFGRMLSLMVTKKW